MLTKFCKQIKGREDFWRRELDKKFISSKFVGVRAWFVENVKEVCISCKESEEFLEKRKLEKGGSVLAWIKGNELEFSEREKD